MSGFCPPQGQCHPAWSGVEASAGRVGAKNGVVWNNEEAFNDVNSCSRRALVRIGMFTSLRKHGFHRHGVFAVRVHRTGLDC